jgi:hypothetical protein
VARERVANAWGARLGHVTGTRDTGQLGFRTLYAAPAAFLSKRDFLEVFGGPDIGLQHLAATREHTEGKEA